MDSAPMAVTQEKVRAAIAEVIGAVAPEVDLATIDPGKSLREQVDIDSFDFLNVIIRLHEVLGVDIPERDYGELQTLDSAIRYLAGRIAQNNSGK